VDHRSIAQCNIRDISERSRLERQTKGQAAELSDLHRRKDEFFAMLSHELRNPIAAITNAVHLLGLDHGAESLIQHQARSIIERQMGQLNHLIDDLLEVSRITTGRVQLRRERIAVGGIVEVVAETVRPQIEQHRHHFTISLPSEPIWVFADAARLEQVVVNLLTNAAKYTAEGGQISLIVEQEGNECVLRVRDTGVGIDPVLLPRIFDLFTQAERSWDRSQGGLGIGLALVQRLTELHGGRVEAYSALGQGSEFVVRLPVELTLRKTSEVSETLEASSVPAAIQPAEPGRAKATARVLMVDDSVDFVESMAIMLRLSGFDVRTAHTGPAALEAAIAFEPEVVFLDIGLPEMNGYEVARHLREQPKLKNVRLVALTGYGQESDLRRAQVAGFDVHLVKPVGIQKLQDLLATLLPTPTKSLGN
jgi:CheY-like chemotaxis protein/nitrogen-specific signal transduction histidine kinase